VKAQVDVVWLASIFLLVASCSHQVGRLEVQSRIAAKQSQFLETEYRAHPNRPHYGHATKSFQGAVLIAQTCEDHGFPK
jgi:hypothetical protein